MSFPSQPRRGVDISDIITGLGMLGNVLALPRSVEAQQTENEQTRALLQGVVPEADIKAATPEPMLRWLSPKQGGFTGKVLGGVGDVGAILSTVVGKPVKAPRMELSDLAAASRMRVENQKAIAQKRLQDVISDPTSTDRQIGEAAVAAGSIEGGLRYLRGTGEKPPGSIFSTRALLNSLDPDDPRRPALQKTVDEYDRQQKDLEAERERRADERADRHYLPPEEVERRRHDQIVKDRDAEARRRGYQPGSDEYKFYMDYGHERAGRQPPAPTTLDEEIDRERRRRDAMAKDPLLRDKIPNEPPEVTARRNLAARQQAGAAAAANEPIPEVPPPPPKRGAVAGAVLGGALRSGGATETPSSPTTSTTTPAPDSDAAAQAIIDNIDVDSLSPEGQAAAHQLSDAITKGMPLWQAANWALTLR